MMAGEEAVQLGAAGQQLLQRERIDGVVFRHHPVVGEVPGLFEQALIIFGAARSTSRG